MLITAIGGGNKTPAIQHTLDLLPDAQTEVLIIPTACSTPNSYERKVAAITEFFSGLGVRNSVLHEQNKAPSPDELAHKLGSASLLYTLGGNTPYMMRFMNEHGMADELASQLKAGKAHAGTSAGALLPFELAHSNPAAKPAETEWDFEFVRTLGVLERTAATAHANQYDMTPNGPRPDSRLTHLTANLPVGYEGFAIDNDAALVINNGVLTTVSQPDSYAYRVSMDDSGTYAFARPIDNGETLA